MSSPESQGRSSRADARFLALLERAFAEHAGKDARIDPAELKHALGLRSDALAARVFALFDRDRSGTIDREEFIGAVRRLFAGSDRDRLLFAFQLHDEDGDGSLDLDELKRMIAVSLAESDIVERPTQPADALARLLLQKADTNRDGKLSFEEFAVAIEKQPELLKKMIRSEAVWIAPNEELLAWIDDDARGAADAVPVTASLADKKTAIFAALLVLVNVAAFTVAFVRARADGGDPLMAIARALGRALDVDGALVLVPMMRRLATKVRATALGRVVPVDDAIDFHRWVGHGMFALAWAHTGAFAIAYARGHAHLPFFHFVTTLRGASGAALLGVFSVMWLFALSFVRRTRHFELFARTHALYVAWFALAIVHAPPFGAWAALPLAGFAIERALRGLRRAPACPVVSSDALRSGVTRLVVEKPTSFSFSAGDYAFLRVPSVAKSEWHPFTISSAPEADALTFHVRSLGNWTSALRRKVESGEGPPNVYVDGPYGSPSAAIFESRFAVLIGAGIGVTPFASVLESIVLRSGETSPRPSKLERAHFFWLNRDQYSFEWFGELLRDLEKRDQKGLLDVHLCMTGARAGAVALGVELARQMMRDEGRSDMITGLRHFTHVGPPDWPRLLGAIASRHAPNRVDVFFCGPPGLARKLEAVCEKLGMPFHEERF